MSNKHAKIRNVGTSTRAAIIDLLCLCDDGAFANDIVPARLKRSDFSDQDRALITNVVYSTLRSQVRIDNALEKISNRPLTKLDPIARAALRSVLGQLLNDFDMYAVVDETIKVIPFSMKGFVNALSRKAISLHENNKLFIDESPQIKSNLPHWIFNEIQEVFTDTSGDVVKALNASTKVTLAPMVSSPLQVEGGESGSIVKDAVLIRSMGDISQLEVISNGSAIVVDQGSQLVAQVVDAQPDDVVLDVCSAPGGKSFLVSKTAKKVIACDLAANRLEKIKDTQTRVKATNLEVIACDARELPFSKDQMFDRILIDAPCSGLGVLRRRPDARHRMNLEQVEILNGLQKQIISSAYTHLKEGGYLIYSVCTFSRAETLEIDSWLESVFPELIVEEIQFESKLVSKQGRGYLLAPTENNDSMYVIKLRKS